MRRILGWVTAFLIIAIALWLGWALLQDRKLKTGFEQIRVGESEHDVRKTLGRPNRIEPCGAFFAPLDAERKRNCSKEFFYASPFSPLIPQYYVVRFDEHNEVSSADPYSSP
jgi:hypothetical protein